MATAYLGLGTNIGNLEQNIALALEKIHERIGEITSQSSLYSTRPWGFESPNMFLNAVCAVETELTPHELLSQCQVIERKLGRRNKSKDGHYQDRVIDIDVLLYDDQVISYPDMTVPHPLMTQRAFVMDPMAEIAPRLRHPQSGLTMAEISKALDEQEG